MRVCCLGSGPSLTPEMVDACRPYFTIAINNTVDLAPWAQVCFAGDYQWWCQRDGLAWFQGQKVGMKPWGVLYPDVERWTPGPRGGLDFRPHTLRVGSNSGFSAINYAVRRNATEIVLLGYDMQPQDGRHHFHNPHPGDRHPNYARCLPVFETLIDPLRERGIAVLQCSPHSALTCFPFAPWREVLCDPIGRHSALLSNARSESLAHS